jgi:hypothetical protein
VSRLPHLEKRLTAALHGSLGKSKIFSTFQFTVGITYTEILIEASKEVGLDKNVDNSKYMLLSRHKNVGQNGDINIANRSFENVVQFKSLGTTVTNQKFDSGGN